MKNLNIYSLSLGLALLCLIGALFLIFRGDSADAGPLLIFFFTALAIGVRGTKTFKAFSYTIWIFTAVTASMFYPQYFVSIGDFQLKTMIVPLLQVIMFGMGSQMSFEDFTGVIKMPKGVIIGVGAHYIIMPMVAFGIAHIFNFPPEIAAGIILIGTVPSGLASNVMSYLAHANLALAVTIGAISTIISPFVTPLLMQLLGGQYIQVDFWHMMLDILNMIIMPIVAGFMFNLFSKNEASQKSKIFQLIGYFVVVVLTNLVYMKSSGSDFSGFLTALSKSLIWFYILPMVGAILLRKLVKGDDSWMGSALSMISMVGIAVIISIITAAGRDSLLQVGLLLIITSLLHNAAGYILGYSVSWAAGMPEKDRRTVAFEVGMQNGGLASGLALQMGKIATVGLAPAIFGPLMNVTGSALASWWRSRPPLEDLEAEKNTSQASH
ncbi:bile acid:sodium symporter family protein [Daejeonella sp. H1SJ63]|uniref:bile acid:sodium symporter family protein n=1 Tax=Daejeonella sp. H1SJ63 TaxID=3034145 RepID=UPI0023EC9021|nr:bile acid:sodium symporter family protein [Daejeonella sp. H1SJ63]